MWSNAHYLHNNQETETCYKIIETSPASRQNFSSIALEQEKDILLVDPLINNN